MAARTRKTTRSKRVDRVRASRDGHQFHAAWVARRAFGLLLPRFDLYGIAVEGLSEEDEEGAPPAAVEIADATFYYGNGTSFESCARMEVAQFKYSITKAGLPLRIADVRKTLVKFAATEKELLSNTASRQWRGRSTVKTLQMCRAALSYAREMVLWRERRSRADGKLRAAMYAPPHHEIRGLKSRMRKG